MKSNVCEENSFEKSLIQDSRCTDRAVVKDEPPKSRDDEANTRNTSIHRNVEYSALVMVVSC